MSGRDGILLVDKPEGCSSAEVVRRLKKALSAKKIGHLGTLDPFASGLLPICIGAGTKLSQFLMAERKSYDGTIQLGVETDTLDCTGAVTRRAPVPACSLAGLKELERQFTGEYSQTPPMYSALKQKGVPLYKLARKGIDVERAPRQVHIDQFTLGFGEQHTLHFSVSCSKGTYIRVLAADVGQAMKSAAHLTKLRRTVFGSFTLDQAIPLSRIEDVQQEQALPLLSLSQATEDYRSFSVSGQTVTFIKRGQQEVLRTLPPAQSQSETARVLDVEGELVAILKAEEHIWKLARVF